MIPADINSHIQPVAAVPLRIVGTGHTVPNTLLTSQSLDHRLQLASGTVERISGVRQRYVAAAHDNAAQLAASAARNAIAAANLTLDDIDCVIAASGTMDQGMPSNAALIHAALGLSSRGIPAFDINASCLGFIAALDIVTGLLGSGRYQTILVVAADLASCGLNWNDLEASAIFGDGAAAAVFSGKVMSGHRPQDTNSTSRLIASGLHTYSEGVDFCAIPAGGSRYHPSRIHQPFEPLTRFHMDGKKVFRLAAQYLPDFVDRLLASAALTRSDLDWIVPHQASHLAIEHMVKRLDFAPGKVVRIFADYGNQIAASLPTALDIAIRDGRIQRGHKLLLLGTGAGLSIGGAILEF